MNLPQHLVRMFRGLVVANHVAEVQELGREHAAEIVTAYTESFARIKPTPSRVSTADDRA